MAKHTRDSVKQSILAALQSLGGTASRKEIKEQLVADKTNTLTYSDVFEKVESAKGNKYAPFDFDFNFCVNDLVTTEYVEPYKRGENLILTKKGQSLDYDQHRITTEKIIMGNNMDNVNYKQLKLGKHNLPTWDSLVPVAIQVGLQREEWRARDLIRAVSDVLGLPDNLRNLAYEKYTDDKIIENRVAWALSEGALGGLFIRPQRGIYKVTELGQQLLDEFGLELDAKIIHRQSQYLAHQQEVEKRKRETQDKNVKDEVVDTDTVEPDVPLLDTTKIISNIDQTIEGYNKRVADELLNRIREAEPEFFEHLVVDLLVKMGYQGIHGNSIVTPNSHDGGIDGVINQDPLGTSTVYVQAKRYQATNIVQRPAIDGFYGALSRVHADRGVFITTSGFSEQAKQTARTFSIILIDGLKLTNLMLQYQVGVQVKRQYELFTVDEDYFEFDD